MITNSGFNSCRAGIRAVVFAVTQSRASHEPGACEGDVRKPRRSASIQVRYLLDRVFVERDPWERRFRRRTKSDAVLLRVMRQGL